ncbi:putative heterokaryon incompatibility protein [Colletotrichum sublineola]|uniref:Putative heterokaryon incompatibility protein n=1 Tax=Colletotrichum sublineola TaxID=1173701 RepID=A0A066XB07_COLSU|nr:putative heterokaryon incompatibility protein [Colletotrichum sublineola]
MPWASQHQRACFPSTGTSFAYAEAVRQEHFIDKTVVPLATRWLEKCVANHPSCGETARHSTVFCTDSALLISDLEGNELVATRLFFFSLHPPSEETDIARLQLSESLGPDTRYVALSHPRGAREICCTAAGNFEGMIETGVLVSKLTAMFRDAIYIARGMVWSYVWIDSLCIVQDDKEAWESEAQRMAIIYDNATCTIAANYGLDSNSGLAMGDSDPKSTNVLDSRAWGLRRLVWECRECDASAASSNLKLRRAIEAEETPTHPKDIFVYFRDWHLPLEKAQAARVTEIEDSEGENFHDSIENEQPDDEETKEMPKRDVEALADTYSRPRNNENIYQNAPENKENRGKDEDSTERRTKAPSDLRLSSKNATSRAEDLVSSLSKEEQESPEHLDNEYDSDGYPAYQGIGWPGHTANLAVFLRGKMPKAYKIYPGDLREGDPDPFGDFRVVVTNLNHPKVQYSPFLKTSWSFLSDYSPLTLTYGSDKFLANNGTTSKTGELAPPNLGSWASTRNGRVKNDVYTRYPLRGHIMFKPEITSPAGTAFDQPLPFAAWMARRYHEIKVKGDLRKGVVKAVWGADGKTRYPIVLDSVGRFSDEEVHDFRPDCAEDFPVGQPVNVLCMVRYHMMPSTMGSQSTLTSDERGDRDGHVS